MTVPGNDNAPMRRGGARPHGGGGALAALLGVIDRVVRWLGLAAGGIMVLLALGTVAAAMLRYIFNAPVGGAGEIQGMTLVVVIFFGVAYCGRTGGHVAVDLFTEMLGPRVSRWTDMLVKALACTAFVIMAIWSVKIGGLFTMTTQWWKIPHEPFYYVIAFGAGLYALVLFLELVALAIGRPDLAEREQG
jgi:TRAP-type C4-dicarboxylate transport system permease small subunit